MVCSIQMSAQEQITWLTDYKVAINQSEIQDKPILVFVTENELSEDSDPLKKEFFGSDAFKKINDKLILLKLYVSDKQSYNYRIGSHYIKQKSGSGLALVDKNNNTIGEPLTSFTSKNIVDFITLINSKI